MNKFLLIIFLSGLSFLSKAQVACPTEKDSLQGQIVFVLKGATTTQLNTIKTEFAKYPQITKATYVYTSINYLLVDLNMNLNNPSFTYYYQLIKVMCAALPIDKILIKTPSSYIDIVTKIDDSSFILK